MTTPPAAAPPLPPRHPLTLVLVVHDHQPVGNFDDVIERAFADAYAPFLEFLARRPAFRLALHTSGPLLQWIAARHPGYLATLRALVERGQVELWGGPFYEPILPAIPEIDRRGQIAAMADWLELELGARPRGVWLPERVWEPALASTLAAAGAETTAVDDSHFLAAGLEKDDLWGWFHSEDQGLGVRLLPIHRELRYAIPFGEPQDVVALLARVADAGPRRIAVLGDDGEKFGVWPGTRQRVWDEGWLDRFAAALEEQAWIELRTPSEAVAHHPARGLAYLPSASYHEMEAWALPPAAQERRERAVERLKPEFGERAEDLVRGGHWRGFLTRYPEANRLHKRMLRASRRLWAKPAERDARWREARTRMWRSQCNCPYWHGVFGGLYLPHLRSALYRELIAAESALAPAEPSVELDDLDLDGHADALLETAQWAAWISARGGRMWAFDDRRALWNYGDTLARRAEHYHRRLERAAVGGGAGETIHGPVRLKEPGLAALAAGVDPRGRDAFLDTWSEGGDSRDLADERWMLEAGAASVGATVAEGPAPAVAKRFRPGPHGGLEVEYVLRSARPRDGRLDIELNLGLHVPHADDRWVEVDGRRADEPHWGSRARHERVGRAAFVDGFARRRLEIEVDHEAALTRAPIETVSLSEAGAERVFQGVETTWSFEVALAGDRPFTLRFGLRSVA